MEQKETKQRKLDETYIFMAQDWSHISNAVKRQVGCIIVKDGMIISDGVNGMPNGMSNICEYIEGENPSMEHTREELMAAMDKGLHLITKDSVIHAEMNALCKLAKSSQSCQGATLYCTDEPCINCARHLIQAGIKRVVFLRLYTEHNGTELLREAGVEVDSFYKSFGYGESK